MQTKLGQLRAEIILSPSSAYVASVVESPGSAHCARGPPSSTKSRPAYRERDAAELKRNTQQTDQTPCSTDTQMIHAAVDGDEQHDRRK